jgi:hypothetical protein
MSNPQGPVTASENDIQHTTSMPSTELTGAGTGERVGGVGALPGSLAESSVTKLPEERAGTAIPATVAGATVAMTEVARNAAATATQTAQGATESATETAKGVATTATETAKGTTETVRSTAVDAKDRAMHGMFSFSVTIEYLSHIFDRRSHNCYWPQLSP